MTALQEQAIEMIKKMPDEKIYYIVTILEGIEGLYSQSRPDETKKTNDICQIVDSLTGILPDDEKTFAELPVHTPEEILKVLEH